MRMYVSEHSAAQIFLLKGDEDDLGLGCNSFPAFILNRLEYPREDNLSKKLYSLIGPRTTQDRLIIGCSNLPATASQTMCVE